MTDPLCYYLTVGRAQGVLCTTSTTTYYLGSTMIYLEKAPQQTWQEFDCLTQT